MIARTFTERFFVQCDKCGKRSEYGIDEREAKVLAVAAGWVFPALHGLYGYLRHYCPECDPERKPEVTA